MNIFQSLWSTCHLSHSHGTAAARDNDDSNKSGCASVESFGLNVMSSFDKSVKPFRAVDAMNTNVSQDGAESGILFCQLYLTGPSPVIPAHVD